jgi:cytochrome b561
MARYPSARRIGRVWKQLMSGERRYDGKTIALHWLTFGMVAIMWLIAQVIDDVQSAGRIYARSTHIPLGPLLTGVLGHQFIWKDSVLRRMLPYR